MPDLACQSGNARRELLMGLVLAARVRCEEASFAARDMALGLRTIPAVRST